LSRIDEVFKRPGHTALVPYVTVGYPAIEATMKVVPLLAASGCDIIELGIPFSDPLADGVTIQKASYQALQNGITPKTCLEVAAELSRKVNVPLVFMTYYNPVFSYGLEEFCAACASSGIRGSTSFTSLHRPAAESVSDWQPEGRVALSILFRLPALPAPEKCSPPI